ncbi:unnamed protein product [Cladocopium goreaui]|uniref:Uncharacterized protein n=1 Tax=Cladocopium goreaui TaxID=2562237 RepID=A0A9P1FI56_9DINO|nr:unnamed protein product [Cladocopium goreaui]
MALDVLSAGLGAAITDSIFNPLAMITVRLQVDKERSMYRSFGQCLARIISEEGLLRLWTPGLVATWLRALTQTGLRVGLYPRIKGLYGRDGLLTKIASGATTGALGAFLANPVDLVRVRLQSEAGRLGSDGIYATGLRTGQKPRHAHTFRAFLDIFQQAGMRGLWCGAPANVARAALLSAGQLATYDQTKQVALVHGWSEGPRLHLASSCFSGFVAQVACMPADVVKTRLQNGHHRYEGVVQCLGSMLRNESPSAFYRGFTPAASRQVPVMAVQMPIVEYIRKHVFGLEYL